MMYKSEVKNIITIGASAGGIMAVSKLLAGMKNEIDAAVFVVIHLSRSSAAEIVLKQLRRHTSLPCTIPEDGDEIINNQVYLAPVNQHMLLEKGKIAIRNGALENHWRPAIDVLFRSAAVAYNSCVTGIILTGLLDDGTAGMSAIKRSGGRCIVQDPAEAEFPDMPNSVLRSVEVDYKASVSEIGYILADLFVRSVCETSEVPEDLKLEASIAMRMSSSVEDLVRLGTLSPLTCPDCGGTLVKVEDDKVDRYRCYTGHTFTENTLEGEQIKGIEESLWIAIRMMEERKNLLKSMHVGNEEVRNERVEGLLLHIERLKNMLTDLNGSSNNKVNAN